MKKSIFFGSFIIGTAIAGFIMLGGCSNGSGSAATTFYGAGR